MDKHISNKFTITNRDNFEIAQYFIKSYYASRDGLKRLGILRTERSLQSDYAEWLVAQMLDLDLAENTVQKGFDAIDKEGKTYQIKSRIFKNGRRHQSSWDINNIDFRFDYLICVFFSSNLDLLGVIKVAYDDVKEMGNQTKTTFRFRWNRKTADDPKIKKLYWPS